MADDQGAPSAGREPYDRYQTASSISLAPSSHSPNKNRKSPSLVHSLTEISRTSPDHIAYTFLTDGDSNEINITYGELDQKSRSIAAKLQTILEPGDRAALVYEPSLEYITALVGCFYAGVVAIPVYPPDPMRIQRTVTRLQAILTDSQTNAILTGPEEHRRFASLLDSAQILETNDVPLSMASEFQAVEIKPETLAFLQYTSGSTGTPKGVMLTHANLMFNFEHSNKFNEDEPDGVAVSWLPMYHDMGLIGLVLQALQSGRRTVLMSPLSFVKRPFHWLKAISKYRAYATSGPSFAYELCVQKITDEEMKDLDLSCWTLACNGAEPIRVDTMQRFTEKFAACGFQPETFYPCYGLAEATLMVSGGEKSCAPIIRYFDATALDQNRVAPVSEKDSFARAIVGCGKSVDGQRIAIVDPDTHQVCNSDAVGEIWVKGPGVAQGYWNKSTDSNETFNAYTSDSAEGPFLRTGDLGFMEEEELFVTGRIKDLIIIRGRNHYPQDIERTVESCHKSLRRDHGAAFAVQVDGEEKLVVVQGVVRPQKMDLENLFAGIRSALLHEHELSPHAIVLVKCGEIPRTSSGKIQRRGCRQLYEDSELQVVAEWADCSNDQAVNDSAAKEQWQGDKQNDLSFTSSSQERGCQVLKTLSSIVTQLKEGNVPSQLSRETLLFADLHLESIDLVMLNELIEQKYETSFPFQDFMAELGRQNQRDISMGRFVDFIKAHVETPTNGKKH